MTILLTGKEGLFHIVGKDIQNVFQNLFKQRGKWRREVEKHVARYYTDNALYASNRRKEVICMIDGRMHHGGLADRLRGIVSVYYVCRTLDVDFKINFISPFLLEDLLMPGKVDWRINADEICYNKSDSIAVFCGTNGTHVERPFQRRWLVKNIKRRVSQVHVYTNAVLPHGDKFRGCFDELFRMSPALQDAVDRAKSDMGGRYIAVTCRFQQLLGDFDEGNYEILSEDERLRLMNDAAREIEKIHERENGNLPVLLTSDSIHFLEFMRNRAEFVHVVPGQLVHMDYSDASDISLHLKSFTDLMMLSMAERIYLLKSPKMYNSGFPRLAALIGNKPFRLIRFNYR